jgi:hypothetical protein
MVPTVKIGISIKHIHAYSLAKNKTTQQKLVPYQYARPYRASTLPILLQSLL